MVDSPYKADENTPGKVLLIDEDPKATRLVRSLLSGTGFSLLPCTRHAEGLRLASRHKTELIILATRFKKADAMALAVKLMEKHQAKIVFLASGSGLAVRLRGLMLGALDYLPQKMDLPRMRARLREALAAKDLPGPCLVPGTSGADSAERLLSRIAQLEGRGAHGVVELMGPGGGARLALVDGNLKGARAGPLRGDAAVNAMARRSDWSMTFHDGAKLAEMRPLSGDEEPVTPPPMTIPHAASRLGADDVTPVDPEEIVTAPDLGKDGFSDPGAFHRGVDATSPTMQDYAAVDLPGEQARPIHQEEPTLEEDVRGLLMDGEDEVSTANDATGEFEVPTLDEAVALPEVPEPLPRTDQDESRFRGHHSESSIRSRVPAPREMLRAWLKQYGTAPLLLVFPKEEVRRAVERRVEALGFTVGSTTTGSEALELIRSLRPVAILGDLNLPDMDGRELLARVRSDFCLREIPFLVLSGEDLAQQLYELESEAVDPVILGLESALGPRVKLFGRLIPRDSLTLPGAVEPVGVATLLRTLGACRSSGHLLLKTGLKRNAEVVFKRGVITAVTVHRPISETGTRAVTQLVGLEWSQFIFMPEGRGKEKRQGLGDLDELLEQASQRNNTFLDRLQQHGIRQAGVVVDEPAMDSFLKSLPTASVAVLMRLKEGGSLDDLSERGVASPGLVRAIMVELRRRGAVRPTSAIMGSSPRRARITEVVSAISPESEKASSDKLPRASPTWIVPLLALALTAAVFAITFLLMTR